MNIHTTVERITPASAQAYLERNTNNRSMRVKHVDKLASDIVEGRWHMNGSSVVFNGDGTLLDGQHRLAAIVQAGVPVDMIVVRGVSKAAMATIDANITRKASDVATLRGYTNTAQLIGTARLLISVKTGLQVDGERASTGLLMDFLQMHPHLQDSVTTAFRFSGILPVTAIAAWHYLSFYIGGMRDDATAAMKVLETGIPYYPSDAMHVFRERALKDRSAMQGSMQKRLYGLWTIALAWNDFHQRFPRSLCRLQQSEVTLDGVDYSKL
jgi:hypothetical protein